MICRRANFQNCFQMAVIQSEFGELKIERSSSWPACPNRNLPGLPEKAPFGFCVSTSVFSNSLTSECM